MKTIETIIKVLKFPAIFIFFAYLALNAFYNLGDLDYFFHIKAGECISVSKAIPKQDIFSFTLAGKDWVNHEWLYQSLIYNLYKNFGLDSLFTMQAVIFSLVFFLLAIALLKVDWVFGFPLLVYALQVTLWRFTIRPDNFSLIFLIIFLMPFIFKKKNLLLFLPFAQLFWVNTHGFFLLGPLVLGLYLLLSRFNRIKEESGFYHTAKLIFILTLGACFFNPQPLSVIKYPFLVLKDIFSGKQDLFYKYIQELESPFLKIGDYPQFFGCLIFTFLCLLFFKNTNWFFVGLALVFSIFSLNSLRNMYFLPPVTIAIFLDRFKVMKEAITTKILRDKGFLLLKVILAIYAVALLVPMAKGVKNLPKLGSAYITEQGAIEKKSLFFSRDPVGYPQDMIDFIANHRLPEKMFNNFNLGAILIFNFYPQRQIFIDGRAELYGRQFFVQYRDVIQAKEEAFDQVLEKYKVEGFIISYFHDSPPPLVKLLKKKGFICVYFGQQGVIFVSESFLRQNSGSKIKAVDFESLTLRKLDLLREVKFDRLDTEGYLNMANVLYLLDYYKKSQEYLEEILEISPGHSGAYYLLALINYRQKDYEKAFIYCRRSLLFKPSDKANRLLAKIYLKTENLIGAEEITRKLKINLVDLKKEAADE